VTKCPPGMARAEEPVEPVKLILRPRYRLGRGDSSVKVKNPAAPAVKREAEEDWN
jgi:hypothetical protein